MGHGLLKSGAVASLFWMCMATLFHSVMGAQVGSLGGEILAIELVYFRDVIVIRPGIVEMSWAAYHIIWHEAWVQNPDEMGSVAGGGPV